MQLIFFYYIIFCTKREVLKEKDSNICKMNSNICGVFTGGIR